MKAERVEYVARVHRDTDGSLWADVPDLPGCFASGFTLDELAEGLQEAISMCRDEVPADVSVAADSRLEVGELRVSVPA